MTKKLRTDDVHLCKWSVVGIEHQTLATLEFRDIGSQRLVKRDRSGTTTMWRSSGNIWFMRFQTQCCRGVRPCDTPRVSVEDPTALGACQLAASAVGASVLIGTVSFSMLLFVCVFAFTCVCV